MTENRKGRGCGGTGVEMDQEKTGTSRRDFLRLAGKGVPVVALASAGTGAAAAEEPAPKTAGLRKTEHVRKYLETARF